MEHVELDRAHLLVKGFFETVEKALSSCHGWVEAQSDANDQESLHVGNCDVWIQIGLDTGRTKEIMMLSICGDRRKSGIGRVRISEVGV